MNHTVRHFFELLWGMTEKELKARYKRTFFGFLWLIVNPLLQMLVIGFVFSFIMKEPVKYYYYYLFIGLLLWNFFSLSLTKATPSIVFERNLIKKAAFPRAVIPMAIILSNLVHFLAAVSLFLIPVAFLGTLTMASLIESFIALTLLCLFTVGISLLTSALNVRFRDINFFVQALLIIWFYATPIVYSLTQIPSDLLWLWRFNPLTSIFQLFQHATTQAPLPGPFMLMMNIFVTIVVFMIGVLVFRQESKNFDDWI